MALADANMDAELIRRLRGAYSTIFERSLAAFAADRLESQATRIATLSEALDRIIGMCAVAERCPQCGRPNGIGAVVSCARRALSAGQGEAK